MLQQRQCQVAAKLLLAAGNKRAAEGWMQRERALAADLRSLLPTSLFEIVNVDYPVDRRNHEIPPGQLLVTLTDWRSLPVFTSGPVSYRIAIILERPAAPPAPAPSASASASVVKRKESSSGVQERIMDVPDAGNGTAMTVQFDDVHRDIRTSKYFEHHRLKFEIYAPSPKKKSFLLSFLNFGGSDNDSARTILATSNMKLAGLTRSSEVEERLSFSGVRRRQGEEAASSSFSSPAAASATAPSLSSGSFRHTSVQVKLQVHQPLSPREPIYRNQVARWCILAGGQLAAVLSPNAAVGNDNSNGMTEGEGEESDLDIINRITSYVVLEDEITRLRATPNASADPDRLQLLMALESRLESLQMAVDLGQLSMEEYLHQVRGSITDTKRRAVMAKRAGNLTMARRLLNHIKLMEQEVAEADSAP
jgi:hypothetical protein